MSHTRISIRLRLILLFTVLLCLFFASSLYAAREFSHHAEMMARDSELVTVVKTANTANRFYVDLKYWLSDLATSLLMRSERKVYVSQESLEDQLAVLESYESNLVSSRAMTGSG